MLLNLNVKNLALIEEAEVDFGEGLNVFSGETGAGKSLVVGSVSLALGGRAKGDIARDPSKPATVELVFSLEEEERQRLLAMDIPLGEDGLLIIRRQFRDGRSTAKINDCAVNSTRLRQVSEILLDIHGQHEHQSLLYPGNHLKILDRYGSGTTGELLREYRNYYVNWKKLKKQYEETDKDPSEIRRETDLLSYEVGEIEDAALREGEDAELEERFRLMHNSRRLLTAAGEAESLIGGDSPTGELLNRAMKELSAVAELDSGAEDLFQQLSEIDSLLSDYRRDLKSYMDSLSFSEEEYVSVTERLDLLNSLKLKYAPDIAGILREKEKKEARLQVLRDYASYREELSEKLKDAEKELSSAAERLSAARREEAEKLEAELITALAGLNFATVEFEIRVDTDLADLGEDGADRVEFLLSTNPGQPVRPLKDVASGGELSRVMLALKTVFAGADQVDTLIFDEIDAGISGRTAQKVSESLAKLSRLRQVILITHLPQIAAMADRHFLIQKDVEEGNTRTEIRELAGEEIHKELARLLSGAETTEAALQNAREMKELADRLKSGK